MPAPSSSPPRRTPLGPHANRRGVASISKPADGKENIPPRPGSTTTAVIIAPTTAPQPAPATIDTTQTDEVPAAATPGLPPWRLPGAFDANDDEDEEKATDKREEESNINSAGANNSTSANESNLSDDNEHGSASSAAAAVTGSQSVNDNADDEKKKDDVKREVTIDWEAIKKLILRDLSVAGTTLNEDHEPDSGDPQRSLLEYLEAPVTDLEATAPTYTAYNPVSGEDHEEVNIFDEDLASLPPFVWIPLDERVTDNWELVDYGDEFHDLE